eukprot:TRINITY_DN34288_c0_g1_i1.p1 TRINITY_DN34288_c0_g1~~TRINITY_DN34288_c0_g1_i1.p1  ORF type:complete len:464 (+),score=79.88 TRINITY_DN34288_c0_g1_i1:42-1394(+)
MKIARRWCTTKPAPSQKIGGAALDWPNLGFDFRPTHGFVKYTWKHGSWDAGVFEKDPYFKVHVMSSAIHYGQGLFEGTKAHHCADGKTRLWNLDGNVSRMQEGARRMLIPEVPHEMFIEACDRVVTENLDFLPPYGSGGSMYLRPILFGHGPQLGLQPAPEYTFAVLAIPVSSYYKGGLAPVSVKIVMDADRSAPLGVGNVKVSGNYGADILPSIKARAEGYPTVLYLDAKEKKYIEEFSVSNFIGIKKEKDGRKKYITPKSDTILMSCTNKMLMQLAPRMGYDVEHRPVEVSELNSFDEVAGCGTAVVLMGVKDINYNNEIVKYDSIENVESLYSLYRSIQFGETEDLFKWGSEISTDTGSDVIYTAPSLDETIAKVRGELLGEPGVPSPPQESVTVDMRTAEFEEDGAPKKKKASQKKSKKYVVSRKPGTNKLFIKKRGLNGAKVSSS